MNTEFHLLDRHLTLHRWPVGQKNRALQAWDSADEYLINHIHSELGLSHDNQILVINDSFGALSCWFANHQPVNCSDSFVAQQAARYNAEQNQIDSSAITYLDSLSELPNSVRLVLLKVPKNNGYLEFILSQLSRYVQPGTPIIAAGKTTDIHSSTLKLFELYVGPTTTSLARKKSRLIFSTLSLPHRPSPFPKEWPLENSPYIIINHANVFSRDSLDIGARLLIEHLPRHTDGQSVIDLGCGNGVVGLSLLNQSPSTKVTFVDESYMAVASAQQSIARNLPEVMSQCQFIADDCLSAQADNQFDWVICNPPFHQLQAVTDHIAWQMFSDARRVLKKGGTLIIVGNRNLAYHVKLKRLFGHSQTLAANNKFSVLCSKKG